MSEVTLDNVHANIATLEEFLKAVGICDDDAKAIIKYFNQKYDRKDDQNNQ